MAEDLSISHDPNALRREIAFVPQKTNHHRFPSAWRRPSSWAARGGGGGGGEASMGMMVVKPYLLRELVRELSGGNGRSP